MVSRGMGHARSHPYPPGLEITKYKFNVLELVIMLCKLHMKSNP